jgi:hypothetical protein
MKGYKDVKKHGQYIPRNPTKYVGKYPLIMRSSWERVLAQWLDMNPKIVAWSSESIVIKYFNPVKNRVARYYPDFFVQLENGKQIIIEVKPYKETHPPYKKGKKSKKTLLYESNTWSVNQAKWKAAVKWCSKMSMEFKIMTEKEIFGK